MLWGRLNAAEILIRSLVPDGLDPAPLIDEAHRKIVAEFAAKRVPPVPESESWQWFLDYDPPAAPGAPPRLPRSIAPLRSWAQSSAASRAGRRPRSRRAGRCCAP